MKITHSIINLSEKYDIILLNNAFYNVLYLIIELVESDINSVNKIMVINQCQNKQYFY